MTETDPTMTAAAGLPADAVMERLNDPGVAAALVTLLDNAELLSTLVLGLGGFLERGDMIMDAVAEGVNDFKAARGDGTGPELPSIGELGAVVGELAEARPALQGVLASAMVRPDTIDLLSELSEAATEGAANARANQTRIGGLRSLLGLLRDDEVQRGLGLVVEISRSLGRRMA